MGKAEQAVKQEKLGAPIKAPARQVALVLVQMGANKRK